MSAPCEKHASFPVVGDSPCSGCEIERLRAESKRLSALLECSQGDFRQAMRIVEELRKDAERYRWLRKNHIFAHVQVEQSDGSQPYVYSNELDRSVDEIMVAIGKDPLADKEKPND